jgi:hypothetical protein
MIGFDTPCPPPSHARHFTESESLLPVTAARDLVTNLPRASLAPIGDASRLPFQETPNHFVTLSRRSCRPQRATFPAFGIPP